MRIGINALALVPTMHGGSRTYITNLISNLQALDQQNEYWVFTNKYFSQDFQFTAPNFHELRIHVDAESRFKRILAEQILLPAHARKLNLSVLHSPNQTAILLLPCASVLTLMDIKFHHPGLTSPAFRTQALYYRMLIPQSVRRADRVITISEFTAQDAASYLSINRERIVVVPLAANQKLYRRELDENRAAQIREKYGLKEPFVLAVGTYAPHKNILNAFKATELLRDTNRMDIKMVVLGMVRNTEELPQGILDRTDRYYFAGQVPDEDLPYFYQMATALVFPSLFEGFGLPVVEAFACGCPVICSRRACLPEVAGDAAWLVDPLRPEKIAEAIYRIATDQELRRQLIRKGFSRSQDFSWEKNALRTIEVYRDAVRDYQAAKNNSRDSKVAGPAVGNL